MSSAEALCSQLSLPESAASMLIVSNPDRGIAQRESGVVGSCPALNARPAERLEEWLTTIRSALAERRRTHPHDLPAVDKCSIDLGLDRPAKAWKDICGAGQGVGNIDAVLPARELVARLHRVYAAARPRLVGRDDPALSSQAGVGTAAVN